MGKSYKERPDKWRRQLNDKKKSGGHKKNKWSKADTYSNLDFERPQPNDWQDW